jgi:hypothetical protein
MIYFSPIEIDGKRDLNLEFLRTLLIEARKATTHLEPKKRSFVKKTGILTPIS